MSHADAITQAAARAATAAGRVDLSGLHGLSRWIVGLYNDHRLVYALATVGILWMAGILLGVGIEHALRLLGRETERLDLTE